MASVTSYRYGDHVYFITHDIWVTYAGTRWLGDKISGADRVDLVTIENAAENAFLASVVSTSSWIGLRQDKVNAGPADAWHWVGGVATDYTNWAPNEPNDYLNSREDVAEFYPSGLWNDLREWEFRSGAIFEVSAQKALHLTGVRGNDLLHGGDLGDRLQGYAGDDTLAGGAGIDTLEGGAGADVFLFESVSDSAYGAMDRIWGFEDGFDRLDFTALSDTLHWSGGRAFHHEAGEIVAQVQTWGGPARTLVMVDLDGDGAADVGARLAGIHHLTAENFVLLA